MLQVYIWGRLAFDWMEQDEHASWGNYTLPCRNWYRTIIANSNENAENVLGMNSALAEAKVIALTPRVEADVISWDIAA